MFIKLHQQIQRDLKYIIRSPEVFSNEKALKELKDVLQYIKEYKRQKPYANRELRWLLKDIDSMFSKTKNTEKTREYFIYNVTDVYL